MHNNTSENFVLSFFRKKMRKMSDEQLQELKKKFVDAPDGSLDHRVFLLADYMLRGKENIFLGRGF